MQQPARLCVIFCLMRSCYAHNSGGVGKRFDLEKLHALGGGFVGLRDDYALKAETRALLYALIKP